MPVYATIADIQAAIGTARLLSIADHNGDRVLDEETVNRALAEASDEADALMQFAAVPAPTPVALRRAIVDIAVHKLREPRDATTDDSRLAYSAAIRFLERIGEGKAILAPNVEATSEPGDALISSTDRVWDRRTSRRVF